MSEAFNSYNTDGLRKILNISDAEDYLHRKRLFRPPSRPKWYELIQAGILIGRKDPLTGKYTFTRDSFLQWVASVVQANEDGIGE